MFKSVIIKKIEIAPAISLSGLQIVSPVSYRFLSEPEFTEINIKNQADVKVEDVVENNTRVFTTTLSFTSCDKTPLPKRRMTYRLTAVDGTQYLIGTNSRPYPISTESNPFPDKPTESILKKVTVKWISRWPMLKLEN